MGLQGNIEIRHCANIELEADEQVTFFTPSGAEYDVVRKSWGYYATPSLNRRLLSFGLDSALVRSSEGQLYVLLVERGKGEEFEAYLKDEGMEVVLWLGQGDGGGPQDLCFLCGSGSSSLIFRYTTPPPRETPFALSTPTSYYREVWRCRVCGHFRNRHRLGLEELYRGAYTRATYGAEGMREAFERIRGLPPQDSDNFHRVKRILQYFSARKWDHRPSVLDVGSGLCVFLNRMKEEGWQCTALDPDPRAVEHARRYVGVEALEGDFREVGELGSYDLIAFNKVLEHVEDPVGLLKKSHLHLCPGGVVYVEVPDGEAARWEGPGREEFFIEHYHVFSLASLGLLAARAGFRVQVIERVREPSGKYTLRAFLHSEGGGSHG